MIETIFPLGVGHYVLGGALVGLGVAIPYVLTGLVTGVSTFFTATWSYVLGGSYFQNPKLVAIRAERLALALGLVSGGLIALYVVYGGEAVVTDVAWYRLLLGGMFVGMGARISGGCTSGHAICGIGSLEKVSVIATLTFLFTGIIVATITAMLWPL